MKKLTKKEKFMESSRLEFIVVVIAIFTCFSCEAITTNKSIKDMMSADKRISKFMDLLKKLGDDNELIKKMDHRGIGIFAPINSAIINKTALIQLKDMTKLKNALNVYFLQNDAFVKTESFTNLPGKTIDLITYNEDGFSKMKAISEGSFWLKTKKTDKNSLNGAFFSNLSRAENGFYTVIDQTIRISKEKFIASIPKLGNNFKISLELWKKLEKDENIKKFVKFKDGEKNQELYGTVFLPTDEAWKAIPNEALNLIKNDITILKKVMANHYVIHQIALKTQQNKITKFKFGFAENPTELAKMTNFGSIYASGEQSDRAHVRSGGASDSSRERATILTANVPFSHGFIHVIDRVFHEYKSRPTLMQSVAPLFLKAIENISELKTAMMTSQLVLPINDQHMKQFVQPLLAKMNDNEKRMYLEMHFLDRKIGSGSDYEIWNVFKKNIKESSNVRFVNDKKASVKNRAWPWRVDARFNASSGWGSGRLTNKTILRSVEGHMQFVDNLVARVQFSCTQLFQASAEFRLFNEVFLNQTDKRHLAMLNRADNLKSSVAAIFAPTNAGVQKLLSKQTLRQKLENTPKCAQYLAQRMIVTGRADSREKIARAAATIERAILSGKNLSNNEVNVNISLSTENQETYKADEAVLLQSNSSVDDKPTLNLVFGSLESAQIDVIKSGGILCGAKSSHNAATMIDGSAQILVYPSEIVLFSESDLTRKLGDISVCNGVGSFFLRISVIPMITQFLLIATGIIYFDIWDRLNNE